MVPSMFAGQHDQAPDAQAVHVLASESRVSIDEVARLYGHELVRLEAGAHIKGFLPIFAIRNVRKSLRKRRDKTAHP